MITLLPMTSYGIGAALGQDFQRIETPERMAWVVWLLKELPDNEITFPCGKWATIQNIEAQLKTAATNKLRTM